MSTRLVSKVVAAAACAAVASAALTPVAQAAPNAPRNVSVVADIEQLTVYWDAPEGTPVTSYSVSCQATAGSGSTSLVSDVVRSSVFYKEFDNLASGVSYECRVSARDASGDSVPAVAPPLLVVGAPQPPAISTISPTSGGLSVSITPPANTGGLPILDYRVSCGSEVVITGTTTVTVSLPDSWGQVSCSARARNSAGVSAASSSVAATPGQKPKDAKISRVSAAQPGQLVATVSASSQPASPVIKYTVTCLGINGATVSGTGSVSPVTLTGVGAGSYTCTVVADNVYGSSLASLPSSPVRAVPMLDAPAPPTLTWVRTDKGATLRVDYARVDGATRYRVECTRASSSEDDSSSVTSVSFNVVPGNWGCTVAYELQRFVSPISAVATTTITPAAPKVTGGKAVITAERPAGLSKWALVCTTTAGKKTTKRSSSSTITWKRVPAGVYSCVATGNLVQSDPVGVTVTK